MIIVCDTNVLISALVFPGGTPDKIVRAVLADRFDHATSPDILTELRRVLELKFQLSSERIESTVDLVAGFSELVYPTERLSLVAQDEADNRILECAVTAKADYLVTGDKRHLLPLKEVESIAIVSPAEFAERERVV